MDLRTDPKKRALETALPEDGSSFNGTVVSSADCANVLKEIDTLAREYENSADTKEKTFIGKLAESLGAHFNEKDANITDHVKSFKTASDEAYGNFRRLGILTRP